MIRTTSRRNRKRARKAITAAEATAAAHLVADRVREKAGPATAHARESAAQAAGSARGWATPRLERARHRGIEVAAPRVESAADALVPQVDAMRDKIVEEMLPRLVAAVTAAATAAAATTEVAHDRSRAALAETSSVARRSRRELVKQRRKSALRRVLVVLVALGAAAGGGYAAWKRSQPQDDPWATGTGTAPSYTSSTPGAQGTPGSGDRLSGAAGAGLGAGTLASESTDVGTPPPDGLTAPESEDALASGGATSALDSDAAGTGTAEVPGIPTEGDGGRPSGS